GINPFAKLPQPSASAPGGRGPHAGAFLYGLLFAPIAIPYSGPFLAGINPFAKMPQPSASALGGRGPHAGAFLYGLLFAPIAIPCSGPFLVGIFAFSLTIGDAVGRILFFGVFGIGFGLPLFLLGTVGQARGAQLARALVQYERPLQLILGVVLIGVGIWDLSVNLPQILA
ncbi:MAG: cytochrome c biogenesis protein CcdA, partial [Candidatus Limnocylindria bacterium]